MATKTDWKCIILGCKSPAKSPHFNEYSYIFSLSRKRLKHNAIPSQNLSSVTVKTDITQPSTSQKESIHVKLICI
ncbi:hypothetical protein ALC62_02205 [Cyphomyrmex costatus]|uniref:THAP-type domain-containing protein n=1 Tax=Cyphomyrmex costatus TaxID=456900 RepID=A0A195D1S6_9HYME|nr:hypothetical protein ALC62_02205 [Cyphomyrmex costatus]